MTAIAIGSFDSISIDSRTIARRRAVRGHPGRASTTATASSAMCSAAGVARAARRPPARWTALPEAGAGRTARLACAAVADTTRALGDLGAFHRRRSRAAVVAITGSNGKTSTRRMTAAIASRRFTVLEADRQPQQPDRRPADPVPAGAASTNGRSWSWAPTVPGEIARLTRHLRAGHRRHHQHRPGAPGGARLSGGGPARKESRCSPGWRPAGVRC
ncbi:MAG: hypothetical protein MZV70_20165 [Desulfobacterales bacterium]|nr:hypothetical protein [Desulfobacterales bacterium]